MEERLACKHSVIFFLGLHKGPMTPLIITGAVFVLLVKMCEGSSFTFDEAEVNMAARQI